MFNEQYDRREKAEAKVMELQERLQDQTLLLENLMTRMTDHGATLEGHTPPSEGSCPLAGATVQNQLESELMDMLSENVVLYPDRDSGLSTSSSSPTTGMDTCIDSFNTSAQNLPKPTSSLSCGPSNWRHYEPEDILQLHDPDDFLDK